MPINFVAAKCPNCKADIQVDDNMKKCFCQYCGTQIIVDDAIQMVTGTVTIDRTGEIENLTKRVKQFLRNGDIKKAEEYCNRILDIDCSNELIAHILNEIEGMIIEPNLTTHRLNQRKFGEAKADLYIDNRLVCNDLDGEHSFTLQKGLHKIRIQRAFLSSKTIKFQVNSRRDKLKISFEPLTLHIRVIVD